MRREEKLGHSAQDDTLKQSSRYFVPSKVRDQQVITLGSVSLWRSEVVYGEEGDIGETDSQHSVKPTVGADVRSRRVRPKCAQIPRLSGRDLCQIGPPSYPYRFSVIPMRVAEAGIPEQLHQRFHIVVDQRCFIDWIEGFEFCDDGWVIYLHR